MSKHFNYALRMGMHSGFVLLVFTFGTACTVEKTQSGKAPDIDVNADPGRWPKYNVNWADVDVGTRTKTVTVPKLEWKREQKQVEVPYIDIKAPNARSDERTVSVEVDVPNSGYDVDIKQVRATGDQIWVVAELKQSGAAKGGPTRVSDSVIVNAPEDLSIRKLVVGQRPEGVYNQEYTFLPDMAAVQQRIPGGGGRVLYQDKS